MSCHGRFLTKTYLHWPLPRTHIGARQIQPVAAGDCHGDDVLQKNGVAVGTGVGVDVGVAVPVAVGVDVGVVGSHTANSGFTWALALTLVTLGFANVGIDWPPFSMATVPVGETKITFEFWAFAVSGVQVPLQK